MRLHCCESSCTGMSRSIPSSSSSEHNPELAAQAQRWIEEVTGEPFDSGLSFAEQLQDGRKLCLLVNKIKPGAVRRVNTSKMPFKQMENISNFLKAIREIGGENPTSQGHRFAHARHDRLKSPRPGFTCIRLAMSNYLKN